MSLNKHTNKIDQQYELCNSQLDNMNDLIDIKVVKVEKMQEIQQSEHNELFEIQEMRNKKVMQLQDLFAEMQAETTKNLALYKTEVNNKLLNQDTKLKRIENYKTALQL